MRRSTGAQLARLARDAARRAGQDAADLARPPVDTNSAGRAGATDTTTGDFVSYGLLNLTTFGEGFRLA